MKYPKPGTIQAMVLQYLLTGHSLDQAKATSMWGYIRLSDAVHELRQKGHNIETGTVRAPDSNVEFAFYKLSKAPWSGTLVGTPMRVINSNSGFHRMTGELVSYDRQDRTLPFFVLITGDEEGTFFGAEELEVIYAQ